MSATGHKRTHAPQQANSCTAQAVSLTRLSRLITICQRAAKAIPLISGTDRAETSGTDRADCDGTRFAGRLFGECRNLFFGLSLFLRKGHPFANDFSARLVVSMFAVPWVINL